MPNPSFLKPRPKAQARLALGALLFLAGLPAGAKSSCPSPSALLGAWKEKGVEGQILFEPDRVVLREKGAIRAATIVRREECKVVVRDQGLLANWTLAGDKKRPTLDQGKGPILLEKLGKTPPDLDISPFPLPAPRPVPPEKAKEIGLELTARSARDQETLSDPKKREAVMEDNIRYLREIVSRYGWIDIPRFGKAGAAAAILIAKHSTDLRLQLDALPVAEGDAKENGGGKELVSILVDEVLIATGHKQKYGTQIIDDENGKGYVLPVEDLAKVDVYRKELGVLPWSDYLKRLSDHFYGGSPVRLPGPDD